MENRFKRLRYKDDLCLHRERTMDELAIELEISKATISHLEASEDYDARVSILKQYKKVFPDVSYDYLLGAKNTIKNEYSDLEHILPLGDQFYETLKKLFLYKDDYDDELASDMKQACIDLEKELHKEVENMLECLFCDSNRLFYFLSDTYKSLLKIYLLENPLSEKDRFFNTDEKLAFEWYQFTKTTMDFFQEIVYKNMQPVLESSRQESIKKQQKNIDAKNDRTKTSLDSLGIPENNQPF